jgi:hypothetical protein
MRLGELQPALAGLAPPTHVVQACDARGTLQIFYVDTRISSGRGRATIKRRVTSCDGGAPQGWRRCTRAMTWPRNSYGMPGVRVAAKHYVPADTVLPRRLRSATAGGSSGLWLTYQSDAAGTAALSSLATFQWKRRAS